MDVMSWLSSGLLETLVSNALGATVLGVLAYLVHRFCERPALVHVLCLLALIK
jgi:hypothetical protein